MATKKVSALTELTSPSGSEELLVNDGGTSKKVTIDNLLYDEAIDSDHYVDASVDFAHIQDVAANSILGRNANSSGVLSEVALATTEILIGDGTGFTAAALSGDVTMANDGDVTIEDNAVSLAKMAGGTDGNIISYDASGDPVAVATGNDGQVLTSAGAGAPPAFEDAATGDLVDDTSPQLGGFLDANGNYIQTEKGGDIASASPTVIDTDGDYFDVTGTTNFAAFTVAADRQFTLQFDGILTMTHHATNLDLPGEANITTAAGDVATFQSTGSNTVQCICYTRASGEPIVGGATATLGFFEHTHTISSDLTITTDYNAISAGPITVASGYSVTVPSGSTWVIA